MSILYEFTNSLKTEKAQFRWTDQSFQVLKAGTPLDANGAIANDATAVGIVAYDVPPSGGSMWSVVTNDGSYYADVELITSGYIDEAAAESSCGMEYTDALKGALTDIVFADGKVSFGESGGGSEPTYLPFGYSADNMSSESGSIFPFIPYAVEREGVTYLTAEFATAGSQGTPYLSSGDLIVPYTVTNLTAGTTPSLVASSNLPPEGAVTIVNQSFNSSTQTGFAFVHLEPATYEGSTFYWLGIEGHFDTK